MLIANAEGKMAVANPNLDEGRNAYATYGGDLHSGTINLNGFLPKALQLKIMQHLYNKGLDGMAPIKGFDLVLKNKPSAELQPKNEEGVVVQNDVDSLQRNFDQMDKLAGFMLSERTGDYQERRLNPTEVFDACQKDDSFSGVEAVRLYNMVRFSYHRWNLSQHKIHAAPITPTFGDNVDHQTSLRTPNLSGQDRAELNQLGIRTLFSMARQEFGETRSEWNRSNEAAWLKRAQYDEDFDYDFDVELRLGKRPDMEYNIGGFYERVKDKGLKSVFVPTPHRYQTFIAEPA